MKGKKSSRSAFLTSLMSLVLCFAMLLGTTLAWFTDTATSGVNRIVAGNLDVEVEYSKDGSSWATLQDTESLFSENLWEPGHTEFVYLRVKNVGTLGLKYKVMVTPASEKGGVNVEGNSFKLSDYLVFGTTDPAGVCPNYNGDRAAARAAVGTEKGLDQADLTKTGMIRAGQAEQYLALVVYMPEGVGNEANYKTGTTAPSIDLGITVVATQLEAELDSFDKNYDAGAETGAPEYVVGPTYDYFPQVMASAPVVASGNTVITATGKLNSSDTENTTLAEVKVPHEAVANGKTELTVKVVPKEATDSGALTTIATETAAGRETANFDIKVDGIKDGNTADIDVKVFVGTGLANVKVYHNGTQITEAAYDALTGYVTFKTTSFSDFTVTYDAAVAAIGTKTYGSLKNAVAAVENGGTIILLKDCKGDGIGLYENPNAGQTKIKDMTINFNGFTYTVGGSLQGSTGTVSQAFHLEKDCSVTLKNGTLTSTNARMLIQNYCNLTLDNMTIDGTECGASYVVSNNNGNVVIKDTTITAPEGKVAFDVCRYSNYVGPEVTVEGNSVINGNVEISSSDAKEGAVHKLNVTGGTFNGKIYQSGESPNFVGNITGGTFTVSTSSELETLLGFIAAGASGVTINLAKDITLTNPIEIKGSVKLVGTNGSELKIPGANSARVININDNTAPITLTLKDLDIVGPTTGTYTRGVSAYNNSGALKIVLDNCSVSANYYALNIAGANANVEVVVKNSTLVGWCAAQTWAAGTKATFENCTLIGNNDKSYNAEGWNNFATFVINNDGSTIARDVELTFNNCRIEANQTTGNKQYLLSVRASGAKVTLDGCTFFADGSEIADENLGNYINIYPAAADLVLTIDGVVIPIG